MKTYFVTVNNRKTHFNFFEQLKNYDLFTNKSTCVVVLWFSNEVISKQQTDVTVKIKSQYENISLSKAGCTSAQQKKKQEKQFELNLNRKIDNGFQNRLSLRNFIA